MGLGKILKKALGIATMFIPGLEPVGLALNAYNVIKNPSPLGVLGLGLGALNYGGAFSGGSPNLGQLSDNSFMGDMGGGGGSFTGSGSLSNFTSGFNPSDIQFNPGTSSIPSGEFSLAQYLPNYDLTPPTLDQLTRQISLGPTGAQDAVPDAIKYAKMQGINTGDLGGATNTLSDIFKGYNIDALKPGLDLGTEGGYKAAHDAITGLNNSVGELQSAASPLNTFMQSSGLKGGINPSNNTLIGGTTETLQPGNTSALTYQNPDATTSGTLSAPQQDTTNYHDDWGGGTNAQGDFTNGSGQRSIPDLASQTLQNIGVPIDTAGNLVRGTTNMINPTQQKGTNWMSLGLKGLGGLDSYLRGRKAQNYLESQIGLSNQFADQNAARGAAANNMWTQTQQNPMYGYNDFLQGAGGDFLNKARAQAAAGGQRSSYINSGKMQSDLASLWLKNQNQRAQSLAGGFQQTNPYSSSDMMAMQLAKLKSNSNAPLYDSLAQIAGGW